MRTRVSQHHLLDTLAMSVKHGSPRSDSNRKGHCDIINTCDITKLILVHAHRKEKISFVFVPLAKTKREGKETSGGFME